MRKFPNEAHLACMSSNNSIKPNQMQWRRLVFTRCLHYATLKSSFKHNGSFYDRKDVDYLFDGDWQKSLSTISILSSEQP